MCHELFSKYLIKNPLTDSLVSGLSSSGLYAENAIDVARREMAWEVDYLREARNGQHFRWVWNSFRARDIKGMLSQLSTCPSSKYVSPLFPLFKETIKASWCLFTRNFPLKILWQLWKCWVMFLIRIPFVISSFIYESIVTTILFFDFGNPIYYHIS